MEPFLDDLAGAKSGERVVARLTRAGERGRNARMVVERVIGLEADPATDADAIIEEFRLRNAYPDEGVAQARAAVAPAEAAPRRFAAPRRPRAGGRRPRSRETSPPASAPWARPFLPAR